MNRQSILLAAIVLSSMIATAQNKVGEFSIKPMAGINVSNISVDDEADYNVKVGFTGGVETEYGVTPWLGVSLGAIYSQQGAKLEESILWDAEDAIGQPIEMLMTLDGKIKADYINLPLLANLYVYKGLALRAGVQFGFLVNDKYTYTSEIHAGSRDNVLIWIDASESSIGKYIGKTVGLESDVCKSVVFGIPVGLSCEYKNITLDARYYFGLTRMDDAKEDPAARNRCLSITLGYKFKL